MIPEIIQQKIREGQALKMRHPKLYPKSFNNKVPLKVKMVKRVVPDIPMVLFLTMTGSTIASVAPPEKEYYVSVNSYGAVTIIFEDGAVLGVKPDEFEVIEWHE